MLTEQNGGNVRINELEDQARAILVQLEENYDVVEQQLAIAHEQENAENNDSGNGGDVDEFNDSNNARKKYKYFNNCL